MATRIDILHFTSCRYTGNVRLGPHRLMIQPREGSGVRLESSEILTSPPADLSWTEDVYGNSIVIAEFHSIVAELLITARAGIELRDGSAQSRSRYVGFPISYSDQERDAPGPSPASAIPIQTGRPGVGRLPSSTAFRQRRLRFSAISAWASPHLYRTRAETTTVRNLLHLLFASSGDEIACPVANKQATGRSP